MNPSANIKNFTPLIDDLVARYGIITAAAWGRVWRYAQQKNRVCQASNETIANELNISLRTVTRHLKILIEDGYIKDHDEGVRNRPHRFSITNKAFIEVTIEAKEGMSNDDEVCQGDIAGMSESPVRYVRKTQEETIKKQFKKDNNSGSEELAEVYQLYEQEIGVITGMIGDQIQSVYDDIPVQDKLAWFSKAIELAVGANARRWNYVKAVLLSWIAAGKVVEKITGNKPTNVSETLDMIDRLLNESD